MREVARAAGARGGREHAGRAGGAEAHLLQVACRRHAAAGAICRRTR